jgi:hypothetical protein
VGTSRAAPSNSATARAFLLRTIAAILLGLWLLGLVRDVVSALIHIVLVVGLIVLAVKLVSHVRSRSGPPPEVSGPPVTPPGTLRTNKEKRLPHQAR